MSKELQFLKSALTEENIFNTTEEILEWIKNRNQEVRVSINRIPLLKMKGWKFDRDSSNLVHESGRFFSIQGISVETNLGPIQKWRQPIINQPEVGFLGYLTKEFDGILYFLVQAKIEPGNVNNVQISPTLQATKSNYTQVHGGNKPRYLEYFQDRENNEVLLDQLQSEQGARFLKKRNRNIIIKVSQDIKLTEDYKWLTLRQIKILIGFDNVVNMDTRTVISGIPFGSFGTKEIDFYKALVTPSSSFKDRIDRAMLLSELDTNNSYKSIVDIISWFTHLKTINELKVESIPLSEVKQWNIGEYEIRHEESKYFKVIGTEVEISNREVKSWCQPLVEPMQEGLCAFVAKFINGNIHLLVQAKLECGNFDGLEMAPTVQCLTDNYKNETSKKKLPFLDYVLYAKEDQIYFDTLQSEEGGRFYQEQNRSLIVVANEDFPVDNIPDAYCWMSLAQLKTFIKFNNYLNIQARSLLSAISYKR